MSSRSVAAKTVRGSAYSIAASAITIGLGFVRSVLLARLLTEEDFGVVALALFFLTLSNQIGNLGLTGALIHRDKDVEKASSTHFVLSLGIGLVTFALVLLASPILLHFYSEQPQMVWVLIGFSAIDLLQAVNKTPTTLLQKDLRFRYIAVLDVVSSLVMTIAAPLAAYMGLGFWSLLVERAAGQVTRLVLLWLVRRPWQPRWKYDLETARWMLRFGSVVFLSRNVVFLLDRFDDFWIGSVLGPGPLGYYSRAYEFARYPRRTIANPVMTVLFPTFAKVQHDRLKLSQAFYRVLSLIVRAGFLFAGALVLITPEFIRIFLGERWMPIALTFRLMIIYTLVDPILASAGQLATAVGAPEARLRSRVAQLVFFVPAVILGAHLWGIDGVAIAADLMLLVGMVGLFPQLRRWVDFSLRRMLGFPMLGLVLGLTAGFLTERILISSGDWISLVAKVAAMIVPYSAILLLFERQEYQRNLRTILNLMRGTRREPQEQTDGAHSLTPP